MGEGDACCGLGGVYQQMGEYDRAVNFHQKDLKIAQVGVVSLRSVVIKNQKRGFFFEDLSS